MFENLDDPRRQAMLALAAGLLSPVRGKGWSGFGEALGQGINSGLLGLNTANRTQEAMRRGEMERKLEEARLAQLKQAQEAQAYMGQGIGKFMNPGVRPATPNDDNGNPMPSSPAGFDQPGFAQYLAQNPATAREALNYLPQPKQPKMGFAPDGTAVDLNSLPVGKNFAPQKQKYQAGDIRSYEVGRFKITEEFDGSKWVKKGSSAIDKPDSDGGQPKAPQGYRWKGDALEPIPGGPADAKVGKEADALARRQAGALDRADFVLGKVGEAIKETGPTTAGPLGAVMRNVPGSGAYNLNKTLDAVKANIGFAELQAMREASPTGGALGQVAVQELNMLQSVLGSLDTAQSPQQLEKSLYAIEKHYRNWKETVKKAQQAWPNVDDLVKKYGGG